MEHILPLILEQVVPLVLSILGGLLAKALYELSKWLKQKHIIENEEAFRKLADELVSNAVTFAAEEARRLQKSGAPISGPGKLAMAVSVLRNSLKKAGYSEDDLPLPIVTTIHAKLGEYKPT